VAVRDGRELKPHPDLTDLETSQDGTPVEVIAQKIAAAVVNETSARGSRHCVHGCPRELREHSLTRRSDDARRDQDRVINIGEARGYPAGPVPDTSVSQVEGLARGIFKDDSVSRWPGRAFTYAGSQGALLDSWAPCQAVSHPHVLMA
jgi:hypothetical protein